MNRPVLIPPESGAAGSALLEQLRRALTGSGPALGLGLGDDVDSALLSVPDPVALVVETSGSTAHPRRVLLEADALMASARATQERLGGAGQWLLTLPATHVAGIQVLVRSILAGSQPVRAEPGPFRPESFTADVARMSPGERRYVSLVPTQLHRLLTDTTPAGAAAREALRSFDAILVGGAALNPELARIAGDENLAIRTTYGMTETCGGCVYDSVPLAGVRVRTDASGRLQIAGPTLMRGYLAADDASASAFEISGGTRWLRTNDLGRVTSTSDGGSEPVLHVEVTGRADDVIITGGVNVQASAVEAALAGWNGIGEVCVVGCADPEWGQRVVAVVTATPRGVPTLAEVRARVSEMVGVAAAPRDLRILDALPTRGPGKYDRRRIRELLSDPASQGRT